MLLLRFLNNTENPLVYRTRSITFIFKLNYIKLVHFKIKLIAQSLRKVQKKWMEIFYKPLDNSQNEWANLKFMQCCCAFFAKLYLSFLFSSWKKEYLKFIVGFCLWMNLMSRILHKLKFVPSLFSFFVWNVPDMKK